MEIVFLGTGPTGGIQATGRSRRFESSALIKTSLVNVLIDVTRDFKKQKKLLTKRLGAVLLTHGHRDAIGGLNDFILWQIRQGGVVPLLSHHQTIDRIKKLYKLPRTKSPQFSPFKFTRNKKTLAKIYTNPAEVCNHLSVEPCFKKAGFSCDYKKCLNLLDLHPVDPFKKFQLGDLIITPFEVAHSIQPGFPTLGFHFSLNGQKLAYISDVSGWDKSAEKLMKGADVLVIDGAMWGKKMIAHLDIKEILPKIYSWPVKKIIFTQIGHTAPKHEILQEEIKKICPKALPAYDGMKLKI